VSGQNRRGLAPDTTSETEEEHHAYVAAGAQASNVSQNAVERIFCNGEPSARTTRLYTSSLKRIILPSCLFSGSSPPLAGILWSIFAVLVVHPQPESAGPDRQQISAVQTSWYKRLPRQTTAYLSSDASSNRLTHMAVWAVWQPTSPDSAPIITMSIRPRTNTFYYLLKTAAPAPGMEAQATSPLVPIRPRPPPSPLPAEEISQHGKSLFSSMPTARPNFL
jgi:hypothetical protein